MCSTHWPLKNWPSALDHLAKGLVDNKYTKVGKIGEKNVTYFGVGPYKSPTVIPRSKNINPKGSSIEIAKVLHLVVVQGHTEELRYEPLGIFACRAVGCTRKTLHA